MKVRRSAARPTPAPALAGSQSAHVLSGRYRLGGKIGSGGMADVYEGVDTRLRRPVAVKVFRPGPDPQTEDRLATEAVLLARLQHPGLVTVYDAGCHDGRAYLVMQLVDGTTLRGLLARGALPQRRVPALGTALAWALAHVHRAGIVHRDVKPSNVLLDTAGEPHLADFGIARLANATRHTAPDVLTGTAAYLAPEQVQGRQVGPATDIYALGLVLLECLKGELEYQGNPLEAAIARLHRPPTVPTWLRPDLGALLQAMTAQDPEARPDAEHCAKILSSLNAGSDPYPVPPSPPSVGRRLPVPHTTHPDAEEPTRKQAVATTPRRLPDDPRHNRRMAVGTALAALSVALGTTLAIAPGTSGISDDHADTNQTALHPPDSTGIPESGPTADPSAESPRVRPPYGTSGASGSAAGSHAGPASMSHGSSNQTVPTGRVAARHHDAARSEPAPHHPHHRRHTDGHTRHTADGAPEPPGKAAKPPHHTTRKEQG
ncbi:serine/threonine-protein kinase [Streptomyces sp. NPDC007206]|uniref:serine/threonine-protein kinase n=1 Tax=Streptomyces sp. NPDC007206 TaxID=3154317 RepID=UPI0033C29FFC